MAAKSNDSLLLGVAIALLATSTADFGTLAWRDAQAHAPVGRVQLAAAPYAATVAEPATRPASTWSPPPPQSRGRDWVFDTFTPPEIFYNGRSKQFTVRPPTGTADELPEEPFGLELVSVRPEPFRLQLIGFVGGTGNWRGTFENVATGEVFLGDAGRRVPNLGLTIKSLQVQPQSIALPQSMSTRQLVATAVVHDDRSGRDIRLTHRERQFTGTVTALITIAGESATREVRTGDVIKLGDTVYRIGKVDLNPPAIEVTKESPTIGQPDHRTLTPSEPDDSAAPAAGA